MPAIESKISPTSADFQKNREDMLAEIKRFRDVEAKVHAT